MQESSHISNKQENQNPDDSQSGTCKLTNHWKWWLLVVVIVSVSTIIGILVWQRQELAKANADCSQSVSQFEQSHNAYRTYRDGEAKVASAVADGDVADRETLETLRKDMKVETLGAEISCDATKNRDVKSSAARAKSSAAHADAALAVLRADVRKVHDSRDVKTLSDGQQVYDGSAGQVADENVRVQLKDVLDRKDANGVQAAVDAVNASKDAKAQADEAARVQAEQAAAASQANSSASGQSGQLQRGNGGSSKGNSSQGRAPVNNNYRAPAQNNNPAPAKPTSPNGGSNGVGGTISGSGSSSNGQMPDYLQAWFNEHANPDLNACGPNMMNCQ